MKMRAKKKPSAEAAPARGTIRTLEGKAVPEKELAHIAARLRPFAVLVNSLTRDTNNARAHTDHDLGPTTESLRRFGQQEAIQYDAKSRVVKIGNGRHEIAQTRMNWKWIAAVPSELSREELRAFALAHNRTGEMATWIPERLEQELRELGNSGLDNLAMLGFEDEVSKIEDALTADELLAGDPAGADRDPDGGPPRGKSGPLVDQFKIVLTCRDEEHQTQILEAIGTAAAGKRLPELLKNIPCRALIG